MTESDLKRLSLLNEEASQMATILREWSHYQSPHITGMPKSSNIGSSQNHVVYGIDLRRKHETLLSMNQEERKWLIDFINTEVSTEYNLQNIFFMRLVNGLYWDEIGAELGIVSKYAGSTVSKRYFKELERLGVSRVLKYES